jgi:hypothetical protein
MSELTNENLDFLKTVNQINNWKKQYVNNDLYLVTFPESQYSQVDNINFYVSTDTNDGNLIPLFESDPILDLTRVNICSNFKMNQIDCTTRVKTENGSLPITKIQIRKIFPSNLLERESFFKRLKERMTGNEEETQTAGKKNKRTRKNKKSRKYKKSVKRRNLRKHKKSRKSHKK